ncbi:hypothetical protein L596_008373 [Steinernema carpocapsae]|uniref:Uncharacterized protein n=1 Tax=Steinernema carpocapsae TaxID=34508 RepID=A0A4U5PCA3_STECR|nr:hypothetical protein L596_008373 [Steinernema carpocapsae]
MEATRFGDSKSPENRRIGTEMVDAEKEEKRRRRMELIMAKAKGAPKMGKFDRINFFAQDKNRELTAWFGNKFDGQKIVQTEKRKSPTNTTSGFKRLELMKQQMSDNLERKTLDGLEKRRNLFKEDNPDAEEEDEDEDEDASSDEDASPKTSTESDDEVVLYKKLNKKSEALVGDDESSDPDYDDEDDEDDDEENEDGEEGDGEEEIEDRSLQDEVDAKLELGDDDMDNKSDEDEKGVEDSPKHTSKEEVSRSPSISFSARPTQTQKNWHGLAALSQLNSGKKPEEKPAPTSFGLGCSSIALTAQRVEAELLCSGTFSSPTVIPPPGPAATKSAAKSAEPSSNEVASDVVLAAETPDEIVDDKMEEDGDPSAEERAENGDSEVVEDSLKIDESQKAVIPKKKRKLKFDSDSDSDDEYDEFSRPVNPSIFLDDDEEARDGFGAEEAEEAEENEEKINESDDEVAVCKKLYKKSDFYDDEASLSGDDVGSDSDNDGDGNDEYEIEEGDNEEIDEDAVREDLHKQFMKQEKDREDRRLLYLQDKFIAEGDMHSSTDRNFRFKLRDEEDAKLKIGEDDKENMSDLDDEDEEHEKGAEDSQKRAAKAAWLLSKQQESSFTSNAILGFDDLLEGNSLLQAGASALTKRVGHAELVSRTYSGGNRDSMLQNSDSLSLIVKDSGNSCSVAPHSLFTVLPQAERNSKRRFTGTEENSAKRTNIFESFDG